MDQNLFFDGSKTNSVNKICFLLTKFDGSKNTILLFLMDQNNKICYFDGSKYQITDFVGTCFPGTKFVILLFCYFDGSNNKITEIYNLTREPGDPTKNDGGQLIGHPFPALRL